MLSNDIRDLLGRYSTGLLSAEEQKRLFDAAIADQDLFDQLAHEQDIKQLIDAPGARDRLISALEPPKRRAVWTYKSVFGVAATAALSAALVFFMLRPVPKPRQVAIVKAPAPVATVAPLPSSQPQRTPVPATPKAKSALPVDAPRSDGVEKDAANKVADRKELDEVAAAPPPPPAARAVQKKAEALQTAASEQNAPSGPRQMAQQRLAAPAATGAVKEENAFGFHYSVETKGHLIVIPAADGYLSVISSNGEILFASKRIAAGILVNIVVPTAPTLLSVSFSVNASPVPIIATVCTEPEGSVQGQTALAIKIQISAQP